MGCELNKTQFNILETRIKTALTVVNNSDGWGKIMGIASAIKVSLSLKQITPEEVSRLSQEIIGRYPQCEERLREELQPKDNSVILTVIPSTASPQP
jgi:hypothetical protein